MNTWYYFDAKDAVLGITTIPEIEVELAVEVSIEFGQPECVVKDVLIDGKSLLRGDAWTAALAARIRIAAQDEIDAGGDLWDRVRDSSGLVYHGLGGNDPEGFWTEAA